MEDEILNEKKFPYPDDESFEIEEDADEVEEDIFDDVEVDEES